MAKDADTKFASRILEWVLAKIKDVNPLDVIAALVLAAAGKESLSEALGSDKKLTGLLTALFTNAEQKQFWPILRAAQPAIVQARNEQYLREIQHSNTWVGRLQAVRLRTQYMLLVVNDPNPQEVLLAVSARMEVGGTAAVQKYLHDLLGLMPGTVAATVDKRYARLLDLLKDLSETTEQEAQNRLSVASRNLAANTAKLRRDKTGKLATLLQRII